MLKYFLLYYRNFKNYLYYNFSRYLLFFQTSSHRKKLKKNFKNNSVESDNVVIFGSGKVAQNLTLTEKKKLSNSKVIFMNKNLIFWEHLEIWPNYYFLSDTPIKSNVSKKIFKDTLNTLIKSQSNPPTVLLEKFYEISTPKTLNSIFFNYNKSKNLRWAKNINEIMFGHHGSLTTLLNLIDVLNLGSKIMLVGFDMNGRDYFFDEDVRFKDYLDKSFYMDGKLHPNLEKVNDENMFTHWKEINANLAKNNRKIFCNNLNSMLVKLNLVEYKTINNFYEK